MKQLFDRYKIHFLILAIMMAIAAIFVMPEFSGKGLQQQDITQYKGAASEITKYQKEFNEDIIWTNSQFGGMPTYMIKGLAHKVLLSKLRIPKKPAVWSKIFLYLLGGYIMFISFRLRPWLALIGAVALGFATENFTIITVGHNTKALAIAYLPMVIGGVQYIFRKKYLFGLTILSVGMGLELLANHLQITYYGGIMLAIFFVFKLVEAIKEKSLKDYAIATGLAILGVGLAAGANALPLLLTNEYAKSSIRGQSELTIELSEPDKDGNRSIIRDVEKSSGLEDDYAFSYNNGYTDIPATIIPNYSGGDSGESVGLYYGDIGGTSGPKYFGAGVFILMIIGFVFLKGPFRWWLLTTMILAIVLSMGSNKFTGINFFFFDYVPLYNKFRAPSMIMVLVQLAACTMAFVGLEKMLRQKTFTEPDFKKLKIAGFSGLGLVILLTFASGVFNDFRTNDTYKDTGEFWYNGDDNTAVRALRDAKQEVTQERIDSYTSRMQEGRKDAARKDGIRSLLIMALIFGCIWFYAKGKFEMKYAVIAIAILVVGDLWLVGKRYLDNKDFVKQTRVKNTIQPYQADLAIAQDKSHFHVIDLTANPLASARASYFHKSLGGYNAAKIRRYQELWDFHLTLNKQPDLRKRHLINMLNAKYIIQRNRQDPKAQPIYQGNDQALGEAWFVSNVRNVPDADSAILALGNFDPKNEVIIEPEFAGKLASAQQDSSSSVRLTNYHPEHMTYESNSATGGPVVFSEIYYADGWNAYIDDEPADHVCANYTLRGLQVPAGKHKIDFKFEPETYKTGLMLSNIFSIIIYLLLALTIGLGVKNRLAEIKAVKA